MRTRGKVDLRSIGEGPAPRDGVIIDQLSHATIVRYGSGLNETEILTGITRTGVRDLPVGAEVRLTYRTGASYGLWFGEPKA